MLEYIQFCQEW